MPWISPVALLRGPSGSQCGWCLAVVGFLTSEASTLPLLFILFSCCFHLTVHTTVSEVWSLPEILGDSRLWGRFLRIGGISYTSLPGLVDWKKRTT